MDTTVEDVRQRLDDRLERMRWALGLSGAVSILYGVVILVWPDISLYALVILFGAFALTRGIFGLAAALTGSMREGRGWLVLSSLAGIVVGVVTFFYTDMSALALLYVIGAYAIVFGIIAIGGAFWLPLGTGDRFVLGLSGLTSILFGIVMYAAPGDGALVLLGLIAAYALVVGTAEVIVAVGGERLLRRRLDGDVSRATPQPSR